MYDVENYNELQVNRIKAMYLDCLDLLKEKLHESGQYAETEEYRKYKFDLVKLALSCICAIKKCTRDQRKLEDSVAIYFEKKFHLFEIKVKTQYDRTHNIVASRKNTPLGMGAYINQFLYKFKMPSMA